MGWLRDWRRRRVLRQSEADAPTWQAACNAQAVLTGLPPADQDRLRRLATLFLHEKTFEAAADLTLTPPMRWRIAAVACLPVLNLGLDWYEGWSAIVVYPGEFMARQDFTDEAGIVHQLRRPLIGEAWERGPVILSWADVLDSETAADGFNVVIHELAHKLDLLNGEANGLPPLHRGMSVRAWAGIFTRAYDDFCVRVDAGEDTAIDPYASDSPAEFFAVLSEAFFETPAVLNATYPPVYAQLRAFYRQDPLLRLS